MTSPDNCPMCHHALREWPGGDYVPVGCVPSERLAEAEARIVGYQQDASIWLDRVERAEARIAELETELSEANEALGVYGIADVVRFKREASVAEKQVEALVEALLAEDVRAVVEALRKGTTACGHLAGCKQPTGRASMHDDKCGWPRCAAVRVFLDRPAIKKLMEDADD